LYSHLAILASPYLLKQLFYFSKSLSVSDRFDGSIDRINELYKRVLALPVTRKYSLHLHDSFINALAVLHTTRTRQVFEQAVESFLYRLGFHIKQSEAKFAEQGSFIAIATISAMFEYGSQSMLSLACSSKEGKGVLQRTQIRHFSKAQYLFNSTVEAVCHHRDDPSILAFTHVILVFMRHVSEFNRASMMFDLGFPWEKVSRIVNTFSTIASPQAFDEKERQLPEDFHMRGLAFAKTYFPETWFNRNICKEGAWEEEIWDHRARWIETPSFAGVRKARIFWLARELVDKGWGIQYDNSSFSVRPRS